MKKILCLVLSGVICVSLSGCFLNIIGRNPKFSKADVKAYLKEKYGEEFEVGMTYPSSTAFGLGHDTADAYPVGKKEDKFRVYFTEGDDGKLVFTDGYYLLLAGRELLPQYQAWMDKYLPGAKMTLKVLSANETFHMSEDKNIPLVDRLAATDQGTWPNVNIYLDESVLKDKEGMFEQLNLAFGNAPYFDRYTVDYGIGFVKSDLFDTCDYSKYAKWEFDYWNPKSIDELTAYTYINWFQGKSKQDNIVVELNENFQIKEET